MIPELLEGKSTYSVFRSVGDAVYRDNPFYRGTETGIEIGRASCRERV